MQERRIKPPGEFNFNDIEEVKKVFDRLVDGDKEEKKKKPKESPQESEARKIPRAGANFRKVKGNRQIGTFELTEIDVSDVYNLYQKIKSGMYSHEELTGHSGKYSSEHQELETFEKFCGHLIFKEVISFIDSVEKLKKNPPGELLKMILEDRE